MANYTPLVDYAAKDNLAVTDPNRLIRGTELDRDFEAIESSISTKLDADFVLPEVESEIPKYLAAVKTANSTEVFFSSLNSTSTPAGWKTTFVPFSSDSNILAQFNISLNINTQETDSATKTDYTFQVFVKNLDTTVEVAYGLPHRYRQDTTLQQQGEVITSRETHELPMEVIGVGNNSIASLVGASTTGYEFSLQIQAGVFTDTQRVKADALVAIQEIFL